MCLSRLVAAFFLVLLGIRASGAENYSEQGVIYLDHSINARLHPVPIQAVHMGNGFWTSRRAVTTEKSLPTMLQLLEEHGSVDNFRRVSGRKNVPRKGPLYTDSDVYKWIEAASWALASNETPASDKLRLRSDIESLIGDIVAAQESSGYLNTFYQGEKAKLRFTELTHSHEDYCLGHLIQAAIAYYRATGSRDLLDPAIKFANYVVENFGPTRRPFITGHPELEMALIELFRTTGDNRYVEFARYLFSGVERERYKLKDSEVRYMFSGKPFSSRTEFEGHAVRALYASSGATDYFTETGDVAFKKALDDLWTDLTERKMYITGGVGARSSGESFGEPYELPSEQAYAETCAAVANVMWNYRMWALTGEARYGDVLERALYNGVNSGMSLGGNLYCYRNPLASNGEKMRNPWYETDCCPPNIERLFESLPGYMYAMSRDGLYINLYHNSSVDWHLEDGTPFRLVQSTDYPWSGEIQFRVEPSTPAEFALHLRWPSWANSMHVQVNGTSLPIQSEPGTTVSLRRTWKPGDTVTVTFPTDAALVVADPRVADDYGRVAVQRGPLVYALEQIDQAGPISNLLIRPGATSTADRRPELLGGVTLVKFPGLITDRTGANEKLYRRASQMAGRTVRPTSLTFIPYYAMENREPTPMEVWVPLPVSELWTSPAATSARSTQDSKVKWVH